LPQSLSNDLGQIPYVYAKEYLRPFVTGFDMGLNANFIGGRDLVSTSKKIPFARNFYIGFKFGAVLLTDQDKILNTEFNAPYKDQNGYIDPNAYYTLYGAPTAFGDKTKAIANVTYIDYYGTTQFATQEFIGGVLNTKFVPIILPEIGIGTFFNTDAKIRYIPTITVGDFGSFGYLGFAVRHNFTGYFKKKLPVNIALQAGYQNFKVKDANDANIMATNTFFVNAQATKGFGIVSVYGGFQYEYSRTEINYTYTDLSGYSVPISFIMMGDTHYRGVAGANVKLGPVIFNLDFNIAYNLSVNSGLGVGF